MAMVLVLLLVLVMSIAAAAGFVRAGAEISTTTGQRAQADAWTVAYAGLERFLIDNAAVPATFPQAATYSIANGTAVVTLDRVRNVAGSPDSMIFVLRSVGSATSPRTGVHIPEARRTMVQLLRRQGAAMDVDAAFVALNGLRKNGASGTVSGVDQCASAGNIPGLAVPDGGHAYNGGGQPNYIDGNPDNVPRFLGPPAAAPGQVNIDWEGILQNEIFSPDFTLDRSGGRTRGGLPRNVSDYANWPVVRVTGDIVSGDNFTGQGVLIVTGNANLSNVTWRGPVLVGGRVELAGNSTQVYGTLISGLNLKIADRTRYPYLPQPAPGETEIGNGNIMVRYNSCNIAQALNRFGGWRRIANAWADNWPAY
jgi:hypothetical protein